MKRKKIFMETTNISASQTVAQIQSILGTGGASAVMTEYDKGEVSAVVFKVTINGRNVPFRLPCKHDAIYKALYEGKADRYTDEGIELRIAKAKRVAWRQILRWIEAQLALVNTEMVTIQEVFLPYMQDQKGQTLYQALENKGFNVRQLEHQA